MKKGLISVAIALGVTSTLCASNGVNTKGEKDIQVVAVNQTQNTATFNTQQGSLFKFVEPATKKVKVGESIKVALKLKEKSYIYMIAVSEKNNKAYLILPNKFEGYNRYKPNTHYVVPERSADYKFISDSTGTETIYVVSSTHKQSFKQLLNKFGSKEVAGFRTTSASKAHAFMKDILVVPAKRDKKKVEVRKVEVQVYGENTSVVQNDPKVRVFLSTGKSHYKKGEVVTTMLQSNSDGYVSIFIQNPNKSYDYLDTRHVKKDRADTVKMKAQGKSGVHNIIAYFSEKKPENPEKLVKSTDKGNSKDLVLVSQPTKSSPINKHTVIINNK